MAEPTLGVAEADSNSGDSIDRKTTTQAEAITTLTQAYRNALLSYIKRSASEPKLQGVIQELQEIIEDQRLLSEELGAPPFQGIQEQQIIEAIFGTARGSSSLLQKPDDEEANSGLAAVLAALTEAENTANRINASMDRSHELAQESIRDLRATNDLLWESNMASADRAKTSH